MHTCCVLRYSWGVLLTCKCSDASIWILTEWQQLRYIFGYLWPFSNRELTNIPDMFQANLKLSYSESCLVLVCVSCLLLFVISICICYSCTRVPQLRLCVYVYFWFEPKHSPSSVSLFGYFQVWCSFSKSSLHYSFSYSRYCVIYIIIISLVLCRS